MSKELAASGQLSAETIKAVRKHWDNCSDVVALCDMALSSLRGTFVDGVEAAAKLASDATGDEWRDGTLVKRIRALAQGQRESNSNPAPMHGQSKTGLTGSHPGALTQDADELLRDGAAGLRGYATLLHFNGNLNDAKKYNAQADAIDAHLSRKDQS